jgi:hypothetical protein
MCIRSEFHSVYSTATVIVYFIKLLNVDAETYVLGYWDGTGNLTRMLRRGEGTNLGAPPY